MRRSKAVKQAEAATEDLHSNLIRIKNAIHDTKEGFTSRASDLISNLIEDLQDRSNNYQETAEEYITSKPFKALGIALLAGFFLGKVY